MRELDPDSWHVHRALAQNFADMGNPQAAIKEYQAAIAKQPRNADLYEGLGTEYQKMSQFELASQAYRQELKLSPNSAVALYNLGKIDVEQDNADAGIPLLEKAAPLLQNPAPGYYYLGLGLAKANRDQEAVTWLEKTLAAQPSDFIRQGAYFQLARLYQRLHRPQDAQRALDALKELKQKSTDHTSP
jgi:tetratricopeptide (TPR) repeat protein